MTITGEPRTAACRAAVSALPLVAAGEGSGFSIGIPGGRRVPLRLHVAESWADLTVDPGEQAVRTSPWDALAVNASADGAAKLILRPGDLRVTLRADVPLSPDEDPSPRLAAACEDLGRLAGALERRSLVSRGGDEPPRAQDTQGPAVPDEPADVDMALLLTEAGWPFVRRTSNRLAVDLGLCDQFQQAFITPDSGRRHRVRATLAVAGTLPAATRDALGVLLLTVSAAVRLARGGCASQGEESVLFVESPLGETPAVGDVDVALCAVAMACQMAGRETRALIDERIARAYLAARGWAA